MKRLALALFLCFGLAQAGAAQLTIGAPGGNEVRTWGVGNTAIYGQTITAPTVNVLEDFSFWLGRTSPLSSTLTPSIDFRAYVYAWDASLNTVSGSALFTSALYTHNATQTSPFTQYTFSTGGLSLASGSMYVMFLQEMGGSGGIFFQSTTGNEYTGGDFVYLNGSDATSTWEGPGFPSATDLRFAATFSVPEPGTWALLLSGLIGLAVVARRRQAEPGSRLG